MKKKSKAVKPEDKKGPGGRPTKFTPETRQRIIEAVRAGASYQAIADFARISYRSLRAWIKAGEEEVEAGISGEFSQFLQDVKESEGGLEVLSIASIRKAGVGGTLLTEKTVERKDGTIETTKTFSQPQWQALAWIMTNRFRDRWGQQAALPELPFSPQQPLMTLKRETIDIYDPDRLARLIGAFGDAGLIPAEVIAQIAGSGPA